MKKRQSFLNVYSELNKWLAEKGFKQVYKMSHMDYNHSMYSEYVDGMHGVECYENKDLGVSIRFLRDNLDHKILIVHVGKNSFPEMVRIPALMDMVDTLISDKLKSFYDLIKKYE